MDGDILGLTIWLGVDVALRDPELDAVADVLGVDVSVGDGVVVPLGLADSLGLMDGVRVSLGLCDGVDVGEAPTERVCVALCEGVRVSEADEVPLGVCDVLGVSVVDGVGSWLPLSVPLRLWLCEGDRVEDWVVVWVCDAVRVVDIVSLDEPVLDRVRDWVAVWVWLRVANCEPVRERDCVWLRVKLRVGDSDDVGEMLGDPEPLREPVPLGEPDGDAVPDWEPEELGVGVGDCVELGLRDAEGLCV